MCIRDRGIPYHSPNLHPGPCNNVGIRPRTVTQTDTQTRVTTIHFSWSTTHAKCKNVAENSDIVAVRFSPCLVCRLLMLHSGLLFVDRTLASSSFSLFRHDIRTYISHATVPCCHHRVLDCFAGVLLLSPSYSSTFDVSVG